MGRVALEVTIEGAIALGHGEFVVRLGEVIHADVNVAGTGELFDGHLQDVELLLRSRQLGFVDPALGLEHLWQVGVVKDRETIRIDLKNAIKGPTEALDALERQAVDQIDGDGFEAFTTSGVQYPQRLLIGLDAIDRLLHLLLEVLHPETHTVKTDFTQQGDGVRFNFTRVDLDGVLAGIVVVQVEALAGFAHQRAHFVVADEGRCTAAPVELIHGARFIEQFALHLQFTEHPLQVGCRLAAVLGHYLVASAVETDGVAERNMEIERQRIAAGVAVFRVLRVLLCAKTLMELHGGRIGGVARPGFVVALDQFQVEYDVLCGHYIS